MFQCTIGDLEYEKNLISNEFMAKLGLTYEEDDVEPCVIFGRSFLKLTKAIVDFGSGILTIWPETITFDSDDDELDALLASINVDELPPINLLDFPPFVCNIGKSLRNKNKPTKTYKMSYDGKGPSLTMNHPKTQEEQTGEEMEEELYERIMLLNEKRPIIETLKYGDKHKKFLDSVLFDKLKLDEESELEDEIVGEQLIREYKAIKDSKDPGCFVSPIHLEEKFDFHALIDTGSNINMIPYRIYELLDREKVKPRIDKVRMIDHSKAKTIGRLLDVLCQVEVTTLLANFMLLDVPVDRDVPIIVERSFMYTCGAIMNTLKGKLTTFDGFMHQQFRMAKNVGNEVRQNAVQNPGIQIVENMNGLSVVSEIANQYGNGNVVTTPAEGNGNGINDNPIRCYNCQGEGHYASNCTVKSRKWDAAYLQQQLQIAQEEEAGIQSTQEEFEFMTTADAHENTERVKVNCTSEETLQQASTSGTQSDNALVYDSDGSTEVPKDENCYDHDIFNMLTHEVQYTDLQTELDLYNDMQQKIERLGDLKGKSSDTQCASNTLDSVSQKLKDKNVSLEFQVQNYAKDNEHLKTTYKNLFDSIKVTHAQTNSIIDSLQRQLYDTIYENAKLRAQLFDKVSEPKGTTKGTRTNTWFTKQSILGKPPSSSYKPKLYSVSPLTKSSDLSKVDKTNALSKPVTSNPAPFTRESKVMQTVNMITPRIFRYNPFNTSRVDNVVPIKPVKTSVRIKPVTVSQPNVIHKQQANSDSNGFSSTRLNNTSKTRRIHLMSISNNDRVPSKSKSSCLSNNV
ncbi:gag-pol polyprotein [Tanacetum coccineum]